MPPEDSTRSNLNDYEILVCVSGGIAAYKTAALVSALVQRGGGVTVAMTKHARKFVGPVTFEGLTGRPVASSLWKRPAGGSGVQHLALGERADLIVVAPATANIIGKLAGGIADDLVSSLLLGADAPVMIAPAMNDRMWRHPATQRNVAWLKDNGFLLVGPEEGWQACRAVGVGRMAEPPIILEAIEKLLRGAPPKSRGAS